MAAPGQLAEPVPARQAGRQSRLSLSAVANQTGARSGITNTLYTQWLPSGQAFAGLSGTVTFSGNDPSFSEALVTVGTTGDTQAACAAENASWPAQAPAVQRLWAAILKNDTAGQVSIPVGLALPHGVALPAPAGGTCLATSISAGYPFLNASTAKYTQTYVALTIALTGAASNAPVVMPLGLGGEFRFDLAAGQHAFTYVGIRADRKLIVDAIAGSVSAAAVAGAPEDAGWTPLPSGTWTAGNRFVYLPASACSAAKLVAQPSNGTFAVLRLGTPAPFSFPAGLRTAMNMPLPASGPTALQMSTFRGFPESGALALLLNVGDCLVTFAHVVPPIAGGTGEIDDENQSTAFVRVME